MTVQPHRPDQYPSGYSPNLPRYAVPGPPYPYAQAQSQPIVLPAQYVQAYPTPVVIVTNGCATASLVLGILALLSSWIPLVGVIAWPLALIGLPLGFVGINKARGGAPGNGTAVAGAILSGLALIVCVLYVVVFAGAMTAASVPVSY